MENEDLKLQIHKLYLSAVRKRRSLIEEIFVIPLSR
jgi:hypothetical protein